MVRKKGWKTKNQSKTKVEIISFCFVSIVVINVRRKVFYRSTRMTSMHSMMKDTSATTAERDYPL